MFPNPVKPAPRSLTALNFRRLLYLRAAAIGGWILAVAFVASELGLHVPTAPLLIGIALWTLLTVASWARLGGREEIPDRVFLAEILVDVFMLTVMLYMLGGSTNPLTLLLLLPLTVSAALLPARYSWVIALATIAGYTVLLYFYVPLPLEPHAQHTEFDMHVLGMWLGFIFSAGLVAAFVGRMGNTLRERDRLLALSRERALRDERIVALGALAAGAAHELGTPLNTIALLAGEIDEDRDEEALDERLRLLRDQVGRCKRTLAMLSLSAGQSQAGAGRRVRLDDYLNETVDHWRTLRPAVRASVEITGAAAEAPVIVAEQTLTQAIVSVINNAADASPREGVRILARWDAVRLALEVCDSGPGLEPDALSAVGRQVFSTKEGEGLGLGLYLAYAIIDRLGGRISHHEREGGGTCTRIDLPLAPLTVRAGGVKQVRENADDGKATAAGR